MTPFNPVQKKISENAAEASAKESTEAGSPKSLKEIQKIESDPGQREVSSYSYKKIKKSGEGDYAFTKSKYGPLAATDEEKVTRTRKESRFVLTPVVRDMLSVENEEKRRIEEIVTERVKAVEDDSKKEAYKAGYQEGKDQGYQDAYQEFRKESTDHVKRLEAFFTEAENASRTIFAQNEKFIIELVARIAKRVCLKEVTIDQEYVLRLTKLIIEKLGVRENITVKINARDKESMEKLKENLQQSINDLKNLNVVVSDQVQSGGCVVESQWNAIDASIENQLSDIEKSVVGSA